MENISIWNLIGGLGIFLFGMIVFEQTIEEMGKNTLKRILGKNTKTRLSSIITGIVQTCIFQSSTIVTMMTLGFIGAGVIGLSNALGVVIGANVGTTLTPWIISLLGFKLNIEAAALPIIGIGALSIMIFGNSSKINSIGKFLVGFGFLFLGLGYMKESVEVIAHSISLAEYAHLSIWGFVLIGTIITTIMQTSTGATIITLTALNSGIISIDMALGIVIGANMGSAISTTLVGFLSSNKTQNAKKQVALGHFTFNITNMILVTLAYKPVKDLLYFILGDNPDPTIILALFHTIYNLILAIIRTPLLTPLMRLLQKMFPRRHTDLHLAIEHVNTTLPEEVITALHKDVIMFIDKVTQYNRASLMLDHDSYRKRTDMYATLKQIEEKLLEFVIYYTKYEYTPEQAATLHQLHDAIVDGISSSKYIKDVSHHLDNIKDASLDPMMSSTYLFLQKMVNSTTETLHDIQTNSPTIDTNTLHENISSAITTLHSDDDLFIGSLSAHLNQAYSDEFNISEVIKSNRYVLLSCEALFNSYEKRAKSMSA